MNNQCAPFVNPSCSSGRPSLRLNPRRLHRHFLNRAGHDHAVMRLPLCRMGGNVLPLPGVPSKQVFKGVAGFKAAVFIHGGGQAAGAVERIALAAHLPKAQARRAQIQLVFHPLREILSPNGIWMGLQVLIGILPQIRANCPMQLFLGHSKQLFGSILAHHGTADGAPPQGSCPSGLTEKPAGKPIRHQPCPRLSSGLLGKLGVTDADIPGLPSGGHAAFRMHGNTHPLAKRAEHRLDHGI